VVTVFLANTNSLKANQAVKGGKEFRFPRTN